MPHYSSEMFEEGLKIAVQKEFFSKFEYKILGRVDFCICCGEQNLLWAEAKKGTNHKIEESFVQLIFTIKKENTSGKFLPPKYLGAFDAEKIAFLEYGKVKDFFTMNDFDWTVTPSDHNTKEFKLLYSRIVDVLKSEKLQFYYEDKELKYFIKHIEEKQGYEIEVDENNIMFVFNKWCENVKDAINVDWENLKKNGIFEAEFFLADLLSYNNTTLEIYDNLKIILKGTYYKFKNQKNDLGLDIEIKANFKPEGKRIHDQFWNKYHRPPEEKFQKVILNRRDLLVPFDIRERQGAFYTPPEWVELSQKYLANVLGHDWQDKYYIWDCCAGTGNMLFGLINAERIFASTLEDDDVNVMHQNIRSGANLLEGNVFQFDFLNDSFDKLPERLQDIIKNEPEKLVIYINPPYAEATSATTITGTGENKTGVATEHLYNKKYKAQLKSATNELFALFLFRIYSEIPGCIIGQFSTLKHLLGSNFREFRKLFKAKLCSLFLVPAYSFDNVKGHFPIGFHIWDCKVEEQFKKIKADVYKSVGDGYKKLEKKVIKCPGERQNINEWAVQFNSEKNVLGLMVNTAPDVQHKNQLALLLQQQERYCFNITKSNFIVYFVYYAVRHCIPATWLNDRDQFLYPKDSWKTDTEFHNDCLAFTIFHRQNRISSKQGINHFIPFKETGVKAKNTYKSRFLIDYIDGKIQPQEQEQIFNRETIKPEKITFSPEAVEVMNAGRELYKYYHNQENTENDASFYDIRLYFQGEKNGRMNNGSNNETYNELHKNLREAQKILADKIAKKVYEHGFLEE